VISPLIKLKCFAFANTIEAKYTINQPGKKIMKLKVYYIDDEPELLEIFSETFGRPEIEIKTFLDPDIALEVIAKSPPDILFIDFRLPKISGDVLASIIDPKIPKVLLSGEISIKYSSNFLAIFEKPFQTEKIEAFLEKLIFNQKKG